MSDLLSAINTKRGELGLEPITEDEAIHLAAIVPATQMKAKFTEGECWLNFWPDRISPSVHSTRADADSIETLCSRDGIHQRIARVRVNCRPGKFD